MIPSAVAIKKQAGIKNHTCLARINSIERRHAMIIVFPTTAALYRNFKIQSNRQETGPPDGYVVTPVPNPYRVPRKKCMVDVWNTAL
jgi:hypothetical protein